MILGGFHKVLISPPTDNSGPSNITASAGQTSRAVCEKKFYLCGGFRGTMAFELLCRATSRQGFSPSWVQFGASLQPQWLAHFTSVHSASCHVPGTNVGSTPPTCLVVVHISAAAVWPSFQVPFILPSYDSFAIPPPGVVNFLM